MTSEIRANKQTNRVGLGTVEYTNTGIVVSGIVTCTELSGLTALNIAGVGTANTLDINGDIDVDGHTNLDNVSIAGVTTTGAVSWGGHMIPTSNAVYDIGTAEKKVRHLFLSDNSLKFVDSSDTEHPLSVDSGRLKFAGGLLLGSSIKADAVSGIVTATSFSGDGSNLTGISQVGGNTGVDFNDNVKARFGTGNDLEIFHNTNDDIINASGSGNLKLQKAGSTKIEVYGAGAQISGSLNITNALTVSNNVTANAFIGDGSNLTGITGTTISGNANNRIITGSGTANTLNAESTFTYDGDGILSMTSTSGAAEFTIVGPNNTDSGIYFNDGSNDGALIYDHSSRQLKFRAGGHTRMYFAGGNDNNNNVIYLVNNSYDDGILQYYNGGLYLKTGSSNGDRIITFSTAGSERLRIASDGTVHFYGNQTTAPEGDFGFRWDRNTNVNFQITNTNNTSVNAGARITLKSNIGTITGSYYNNGGFYLINSANGYFNYYSNSVLRVNIDVNGNFTINPGTAVALTSSNGSVGKKFGIKSNANNVIIGETESSGNGSGLHIESRQTGRSGDARIAQIGMKNDATGDGQISFFTAPNGAGVIERMTITSSGKHGFNRSSPHYAMHLSPSDGETRIDLHMTNNTTGHNSNDGVQFGYQNVAGAYIWNYENTPIYMATNNVKKFEIHATGSTQIYKGDLLLGPDSVSQMEATIRAWGCSLWFTTIDPNYYHDSGNEFRQFYNKGSFRGDNYLTAYNCPIQTGVGPQNRNFWKGAQNDTRAEGSLDINVGYRGAWFFISRTSAHVIRNGVSGKYLFDRGSSRSSVSFDSFGNNIDTGELSFHCGSSAGYNSGNSSIGGRLGSSSSDTTLRMYAVGVNMENYNAPNSKRAGNHLGVSVINEDGTDYTNVASRLSENLINNSTTGGTNNANGEFNWGNRHSNDRGYDSGMQFSQLLYFDDVQLNSAQWDYLEHYFKVMYGNG